MTVKRYAAVCAVAFLVEQLLDVVIHGFLLQSDYAPFYGTLLKQLTLELLASLIVGLSIAALAKPREGLQS
jgi:hypothetical protein